MTTPRPLRRAGRFSVVDRASPTMRFMADFDFPPDLLDLQRAFFAAEEAWRQAAAEGDDEAISKAYQATQDAAMALHRHPWMQETEHRFNARMALREAARA